MPAVAGTEYDSLINEIAKKHGVDPKLVHAVIKQESAYNPDAISSAGAVGLMQLIPSTAERFGVKDRTDPRQSIEGGTQYLKFLSTKFGGDFDKTVAGYNAGEGAVDKAGGVPNFPETLDYVS